MSHCILRLKQNINRKLKKYLFKSAFERISELFQINCINMSQNLFLPFSFKNPILEKTQYKLSKYAANLGQLIECIQNEKIVQQSITASLLSEAAYKKVADEQNLLIFHLKEEIKQIEKWNFQCKRLQSLIAILQQKYLTLGLQKSRSLQSNHFESNRLQTQYNGLHMLLAQLSEESVTKYERILKLKETHIELRLRLKQQIERHVNLKSEYDIEKQINQSKKLQTTNLTSTIKTCQQDCSSVKNKLEGVCVSFKQNLSRLVELQEQTKAAALEKDRLQKIARKAQSDNISLKQNLQHHTKIMKLKQEQLQTLNHQGQNLKMIKIQKQRVLKVSSQQKQQAKQNFTSQKSQNDNTHKVYESLILAKNQNQIELQETLLIRQEQLQLKALKLGECRQQRQELKRHLYFIQQYMTLNSELIKQMNILVSEDIRKEVIRRHYESRMHTIENLKLFLASAQDQMLQNASILLELKNSFCLYSFDE